MLCLCVLTACAGEPPPAPMEPAAPETVSPETVSPDAVTEEPSEAPSEDGGTRTHRK
jgi:hypothetical protein